MKALRALLRSAEYRALNPVQRVMKLQDEHHVSVPMGAKLVGILPQRVYRGMDAVAAGRPVGICGRPSVLDDRMREHLPAEVEKRNKEGLSASAHQPVGSHGLHGALPGSKPVGRKGVRDMILNELRSRSGAFQERSQNVTACELQAPSQSSDRAGRVIVHRPAGFEGG